MKFILPFILIILCTGCDIREKERLLTQKEGLLAEKEKSLDSQQIVYDNFQSEFNRLKAFEDSINRQYADSIGGNIPKKLLGAWDVLMECTKSDCPGYAVGDKKNETWSIENKDSVLVTRAFQNGKLLRIYSARYADSTLLLQYPNQQPETSTPSASKMEVVLHPQESGSITGTRLLTFANGCKVTFNLTLARSATSF